jgi:hypothetical protein
MLCTTEPKDKPKANFECQTNVNCYNQYGKFMGTLEEGKLLNGEV